MTTTTMTTRKPFNQRPHFIMNNKKITAGGLLIMDFDNDKCLLQYTTKKNRFEDLGGKVDKEDDTIVHTIIRELYEESNKLIGSENNQVNFKNTQFFYIKECKYILAVIDSKNINIEKDLLKYGIIEEHTELDRYLVWIDIKNILNNKVTINPRILHYFNDTCENVTFLFDFLQKDKDYFCNQKTIVNSITTQTSPKKSIIELNTILLVATGLAIVFGIGRKLRR